MPRIGYYATPQPWIDFEGKHIEVGDEVAFNCSGDVRRGVIEYIPEQRNTGAAKIRHTVPGKWIPDKFSRVRNASSILVLAKGVD